MSLFFQPDTLVSILPTNCKQVTPSAVKTVQVSSLPGQTVPLNRQTKQVRVVGPTAKELESIKELIQFANVDHVYHKPQPESKTDLIGQASSVTSVSVNNNASVALGNNSTDFGNVKIIITPDGKYQIQSDNKQVIQDLQSTLENMVSDDEIINESIISDLDEENFDLLADLESILQNDDGVPSCFDDNCLQVQESVCDPIDSVVQRKGLKRKAVEAEIDAIADNLKAEERLTCDSLSVDSGYSSDGLSSSSSVGSPGSWEEVQSPDSIEDSSPTNVFLSNDSNLWEESFTELNELFPDLI